MKYFLFTLILSCTAMVSGAQTDTDPLWELTYLSKFTAKYALDEHPKEPADTDFIAIWKMEEDADQHNYIVVERRAVNEFVFTYMNRGGSNRTYENFGAFFSKLGNTNFINVRVYNREQKRVEYFFLKATDIDDRGWGMTLSLVNDTTLKNISSREALRNHLTKNVNNPAFFSKPVHFHKKLPLMYCK